MTAHSPGIQHLFEIMARLRDPVGGCPWDVQQTFDSIAPYTIEEAYEVVDAIDCNDMPALKDELGDLLLQVVFHAQMASEQGAFAFDDVVAAISNKLTRRHPHVFAAQGCANAAAGRTPGAAAAQGCANAAAGRTPGAADESMAASITDAASQTAAWEELKRGERIAAGDQDGSALAGIARGLPEWQRALKLQRKAAKVGFDWPDPEPVIAKLHEEIDEVRVEFAAVADDPEDAAAHDRLQDEIGDILFVCANLARHAKVDVGNALRHANRKFERRFRAMEALAEADGTPLASLSLQAQDRYWNLAKSTEK